jgi:hypothetical protein
MYLEKDLLEDVVPIAVGYPRPGEVCVDAGRELAHERREGLGIAVEMPSEQRALIERL